MLRGRGWVWLERSLCALGIAGAVACSISMVLVAAGVVATAASAGSMAAMGSTNALPASGILGFLIVHGPAITIGSMSVVVLALATRRLLAAIPAAGIGMLLYWSMYEQANVALMDALILIGVVALLSLVAVVAWPKRERRRRLSRPGGTIG